MDTSKFITTRIIERRDLTHELAVFRLAPEEAGFTFAPGQYATLGVERDGKLVERPYSIASAPHEETLEFFIELVPDGRLTPLIFALDVGGVITLRRRCAGRFLLDANARTHHLMLATVTGIAPFVSMLRSHCLDLSNQPPHRFTILHGASHSSDLGTYVEELTTLARERPFVKYIPTVSRPHTNAGWQGEVGRIEDVLRKYADEMPLGDGSLAAYLCGNPQMIENARGVLQRARVTPDRIHTEQYFPLPKT